MMGCDDEISTGEQSPNDLSIKASDMSFLPDIEAFGTAFYNRGGLQEDALSILKNNGFNTIRLRLWHNPTTGHSGLNEVLALSKRVRNLGMKVWLTVHYSDTWADPSAQITPQAWQGVSFENLKDSVRQYTTKIAEEIAPDYIQIGNEINGGFLFPQGKIDPNRTQFLELLSTASHAIRSASPSSKIILHIAGYSEADWFFSEVKSIDYDMIGLSYYPIWHGKSLSDLQSSIQNLKTTFAKEVLIAETSYPFTLQWNDWTNNVIGEESQLLTQFPPTPTGQKEYLSELISLLQDAGGMGLCYWGAEWVAFKGEEATDGSSWENQTLFDFSNQALPVIEAMNE